MQTSLRTIPDRRRAEGKRFDLATVLLYAVLGMVWPAAAIRCQISTVARFSS
jgi:hypothetical protein